MVAAIIRLIEIHRNSSKSACSKSHRNSSKFIVCKTRWGFPVLAPRFAAAVDGWRPSRTAHGAGRAPVRRPAQALHPENPPPPRGAPASPILEEAPHHQSNTRERLRDLPNTPPVSRPGAHRDCHGAAAVPCGVRAGRGESQLISAKHSSHLQTHRQRA